ncbi:MAG: hypothetical protein V2A67_02745 [Bacteroidota bacterium]
MKKIVSLFLVSGFVLLAGSVLFFPSFQSNNSPQKKSGTLEEIKRAPTPALLPFLADLQVMKLRNPNTGVIPPGIRSRELAFAAGLPLKEGSRNQIWTWRGPDNIGGRMLCIAVDLENEDHLLSGSASGGMWQSFDQGGNWSKVTSPDAEQSATCLV